MHKHGYNLGACYLFMNEIEEDSVDEFNYQQGTSSSALPSFCIMCRVFPATGDSKF